MDKHHGNLPHKHMNTDLDTMDSKWRVEFEREVAANNFVRGGKPLLLSGEGATDTLPQWMACLLLAGMKAYHSSVIEIIRRVERRAIVRDSETTEQEFAEAETIAIVDFFDSSHETLSDEDVRIFYWFLKDSINDGVTILLASDNKNADTGMFINEHIADLLEKEFEVVSNAKKKIQKKK